MKPFGLMSYFLGLCLLGILHPLQAQYLEVFLNKSAQPNAYFVHKVRKTESVYGIAKHYQTDWNELVDLNVDINFEKVSDGTEILIPFTPRNIQLDSTAGAMLVLYTIQPKDNLFALSSRYFKLPIQHLKHLNPWISQGLPVGKVLRLGYIHRQKTLEIKPAVPPSIKSVEQPETEAESLYSFSKGGRGLVRVESSSLGVGRYFALHSSAKMESMIEITNPVNGRKLMAKIIGRIPPIYPKGTQLVVSGSVALYLGVPDDRFYAIFAYD